MRTIVFQISQLPRPLKNSTVFNTPAQTELKNATKRTRQHAGKQLPTLLNFFGHAKRNKQMKRTHAQSHTLRQHAA